MGQIAEARLKPVERIELHGRADTAVELLEKLSEASDDRSSRMESKVPDLLGQAGPCIRSDAHRRARFEGHVRRFRSMIAAAAS